MENNSDLLRRAEDLAERCQKRDIITNTGFLTPAESYALSCWIKKKGCRVLFSGGSAECERTAAFFLPDYMQDDYFEPDEYIKAIKLTAYFGTPGHRDYMGAILGMGVGREWVGDISVQGDTAYVYCMESVLKHLASIEKVGRYTVRTQEVSLADVPAPKHETQPLSFTVMSPRLDAVVGEMFNITRTEAAKQINTGNVSVNYSETVKTDVQVQQGDIITLRGTGKGKILGTGGTSRKGRLYIYAEIYK